MTNLKNTNKQTTNAIRYSFWGLWVVFCFVSIISKAQPKGSIIVDQAGKGNFTSIQAAINSIPPSKESVTIIYIKKGHYSEKIFIDKNNIILEGENRQEVIISQSIERDSFRCRTNDDWGVATINLSGNDITLKNLTIQNNYGFKNETIEIDCPTDSLTHKKKLLKNGHQMALRSFATTRLKVINCTLKSYGGDTVSPWNVEEGMFYFKDCSMEGSVDFYCPRGWAYAENCTFYAHSGNACIWHDGSKNPDSKTVLKNCFFDGYKGFKLGRYHRDAQFYLLDCSFSENMSDTNIYLVKTKNIIQWGQRVYYYNCHRKGGDYSWFANNLATSKESPSYSDINLSWLFGNRWKDLKQ